MGESTAEKIEQCLDQHDIEDTLELPALERVLQASEEALDTIHQGAEHTDPVPLTSLLNRLIELSASIDARLEKMADLLTERPPESRRTSTRRKTAKKTTTKRTNKTGSKSAATRSTSRSR
jgi:hypothetical protein